MIYNYDNKINKTMNQKNSYLNKDNYSRNEEDNLARIIEKTSNSEIISPTNANYPSEYIGYNIFIPPKNIPFTLEQLIQDYLSKEGGLYSDGNIDLYKLNKKIIDDSFRKNISINNENVFNSLEQKISHLDSEFNIKLTKLREISQIDDFKAKLFKVFPELNVIEGEIRCIQTFANKNTWNILSNYWAFLPFFDELINYHGVTEEKQLNNVKIVILQNISNIMMSILTKFISLPSIFHNTLYLERTFNTFGDKMNNYIKQIYTYPLISIDIMTPQEITVQNKLYFSLVNPNNEFGLAIISTCVYTIFQKNETFMIWKIERWRNATIKHYYNFVVDMSKKNTQISKEVLLLMQTYMYNNTISNDFPKSHEALLRYFTSVFQKENGTSAETAINNVNNLIREELDKKTADNSMAKSIQTLVMPNFDNAQDTKKEELQDKEEPQGNEGFQELESVPEVQNIESRPNKEDLINIKKDDELIESGKPEEILKESQQIKVNEDETQVNIDEKGINEAKLNLDNAIDRLNEDEQKIRDDQPPLSDNDKLTSTLATLGSITALGAIGSGIYLAAPLLMLGGSKKHKQKKGKRKTIRNKK